MLGKAEAGRSVLGGAGTVQSVNRALGLLEALAQHDGIRLTELARQVGLSLSTTHRLMTTLQQNGFAQCSQVTNRWHVGREAYVVGTAFSRPSNFVPGVMPFLRRLRDWTGETVSLGMTERDQMKFVGRLKGKGVVRAIGRIGTYVPLTISGMGKALLAADSMRDGEPFAKAGSLIAATPKSIRSWDVLRADLDRIRDRGFAVDDEECRIGVRCVAAVVYNQNAEPHCAVSISGSINRLSDNRLGRLGAMVSEVARDMTVAIGGHVPPDRS
ncbi:IclR family transcriptional regulator [Mesorhizobium sp. YR577]|uniref:IclR family transcriptional regulator n=1 Tax=Mesorhizobium sp. YR577 TaxID=1884373 RepID=UPI0008E3219D|nr:IclR family transcriptional regulator [Mesorhizobium sp. YR577]SFU23310.1 transcriptional regulator, IclR family [Mesorhizobium sp. YR577]